MADKKTKKIDIKGKNENGTMFYTFNQNNSGGRFVRNSMVDHYVVVEGKSFEEIIERAESIGIYFDGCSDGRDCSCCGDRWYKPWSESDSDFTKVPSCYGSAFAGPFTNKRKKDSTVVVHYLDGTIAYGDSTYVGQEKEWPDLALYDDVR